MPTRGGFGGNFGRGMGRGRGLGFGQGIGGMGSLINRQMDSNHQYEEQTSVYQHYPNQAGPHQASPNQAGPGAIGFGGPALLTNGIKRVLKHVSSLFILILALYHFTDSRCSMSSISLLSTCQLTRKWPKPQISWIRRLQHNSRLFITVHLCYVKYVIDRTNATSSPGGRHSYFGIDVSCEMALRLVLSSRPRNLTCL